MEKNCLVTRLKGFVDGNDLPLFNKVGIKVPVVSDELLNLLSIRQVNNSDGITITSDVVKSYYDSSGSTESVLPKTTKSSIGIFVKNISEEGTLWINNLYNITRIVLTGKVEFANNFDFDFFIKSAPNLEGFQCSTEFSKESIDIVRFSEIKNLNYLILGTGVNSVYGDIKDMAETFYENGKTSGTIEINISCPNVVNSMGKRVTTLSFSSTGWKELVE